MTRRLGELIPRHVRGARFALAKVGLRERENAITRRYFILFQYIKEEGGCGGVWEGAGGGGAALGRGGAAAGGAGAWRVGRGGQANQPLAACKRARDGLALEAHFLSGSFRVLFAVLI
jgi:hypothetical protein